MKTPDELLAERDRKVQERKESDLRRILKMPEGRRFVWGILEETGQFKSSYVAGDPHATTMNEGRRDVGLGLMRSLMMVAPEVYHQMALEDTSEKKDFNMKLEEARKEEERQRGF